MDVVEVVTRVVMRPPTLGLWVNDQWFQEGDKGHNLEEKLQRQVEDDSAQGPVVTAKKAPSVPSMDEWDGHLEVGHADYRGLSGWQRKERGSSTNGRNLRVTMGSQSLIWTLPPSIGQRQSVTDPVWKVVKRSLVDHSSMKLNGSLSSL